MLQKIKESGVFYGELLVRIVVEVACTTWFVAEQDCEAGLLYVVNAASYVLIRVRKLIEINDGTILLPNLLQQFQIRIIIWSEPNAPTDKSANPTFFKAANKPPYASRPVSNLKCDGLH